jgi:hypothetical protein
MVDFLVLVDLPYRSVALWVRSCKRFKVVS